MRRKWRIAVEEKRPPMEAAGVRSDSKTRTLYSFEPYPLALAPAINFGQRRDEAERLMSYVNTRYAILLRYGGQRNRIVWHRPATKRDRARFVLQSKCDLRNALLPLKGPDGRKRLADWWLSLGPVHALTYTHLAWLPGEPWLVPVSGTAMFVRNLAADLHPERDFTCVPECGEIIGDRVRLRRRP